MVNINIVKIVVVFLSTIVVIGFLKVLGLFERGYKGPKTMLEKLADEFYKECKTYPSLEAYLDASFLKHSNQFAGYIVADFQKEITEEIREKYHIKIGDKLTPDQQKEVDKLLEKLLISKVKPCVITPLVKKYQTCENVHAHFSPFLTDFIAYMISCVKQAKKEI